MFTLVMCCLINELTGKRSDQLMRSKSFLIGFSVCRFFLSFLFSSILGDDKKDTIFYIKSLTSVTFAALFIWVRFRNEKLIANFDKINELEDSVIALQMEQHRLPLDSIAGIVTNNQMIFCTFSSNLIPPMRCDTIAIYLVYLFLVVLVHAHIAYGIQYSLISDSYNDEV